MKDLNLEAAAMALLSRVAKYQAKLLKSNNSIDIVKESIPVLWFGKPSKDNWLTIATNPSTREFLDKDDQVLLGDQTRFFVREKGMSLEDYAEDENQLKATIDSYHSYFNKNTAYRNWFGKPNGAKLEGFLNGMGGSFYNLQNSHNVIHTDFFPIATTKQMSRVKNRENLMDSSFSKEVLKEVLIAIKPSLIIILGRENCTRFKLLDQSISFQSPTSIKDFPDANYQLGYHTDLKTPIIGLHFKPSEQFLGLGGGNDRNSLNHGKYATKSTLNKMGKEISNVLTNSYVI